MNRRSFLTLLPLVGTAAVVAAKASPVREPQQIETGYSVQHVGMPRCLICGKFKHVTDEMHGMQFTMCVEAPENQIIAFSGVGYKCGCCTNIDHEWAAFLDQPLNTRGRRIPMTVTEVNHKTGVVTFDCITK